ncbi:MAG: 4Fe-4S dicluster domain-containing protein [Hyphomicrobiales bacterium]|nr:4Fe-4S dicluster domain-containing protein [Hyphomicrobiales bacterium]
MFAGGDVASTDRFFTQAIGMGKQAAKAIDRYVGSRDGATDLAPDPEADYKAINIAYQIRDPRNDAADTATEERLKNFLEVQQCLGTDQAMNEANRCFSCGTCIYCDNCYLYCPDMAITKLDEGYEIDMDYCKGCGLCVEECPTGSIAMYEEQSR